MSEVNTKVITGKVRLSFARVWEPEADEKGVEWYSTAILIPKEDKETLRKIKAAVDALKEQAKAKNNGKLPKDFHTPLRDGDEEADEKGEAYEGHYFFNAKSKKKPGIAKPVGKDADGRNKFQEITDSTEVYSGCYCKVSVNFYLFGFDGKATGGNKGVGAGLNNIVKIQDGEPLGGGNARIEDEFAEEDFDDVVDISDDDDFLS